jgi:hypothetical protein
MKLKIAFLTLTLVFFGAVSGQETTMFSKECSITSGYGYANGVVSSKSGSSLFIQMSYQLSRQFSLATEFEHLIYKAPGYYPDLPISPNVQNLFDDYFSLLIKYHLPFNAKLHASLATGWTFYTRQNEYYEFYRDATSQSISYRITSFSDFGIPFLVETNYPLWKNLGAGIRVKYNLNPKQGSTYSAGIGVSLKL